MFYLAIQSGLVLATDAESTDPQGSGIASLIMIGLIIGGGYFLFIRPQRRRVRAMEELRKSIEVGSEIRTVGGIYGTVVEMDDEVVLLDTGGGGTLRVARRAVAETIGGETGGDDAEDSE